MKFDREKLNFTSFKRQRCQVCRCEDKFNFNVSDELWREIVPLEFQNKVVCLPCFDELAREKNKEYAHSIACFTLPGAKRASNFKPYRRKARDNNNKTDW